MMISMIVILVIVESKNKMMKRNYTKTIVWAIIAAITIGVWVCAYNVITIFYEAIQVCAK